MAAIPVFYNLRPRHIRLLDLQPGVPGVPFQGKLREVSLDNEIAYEALSYTWGSPEQSSALHCNDSTIPLTLNLQLALSRLRLVDKTRTLWIDQICINQNDMVERGQQVSLMGDIYRKSEVVIIWIGEEEEETPLATGAIRHLMRCFTDSDGMAMSETEVPNVIQHVGLLFVRSNSWVALRNMFERPYFRRMWIVQEAALGTRCLVYCGSHIMVWDDLAKAALCLEFDEEREVEAHRVVQIIRRLRGSTYTTDRRLLDLLSQTYNLQCTNPRDKVYGILGLASDIDVGDLNPDYSLTCQEVYISVTKYCIQKYQSLAVLSCVRNPKTLSGLPSWVPDWNAVSKVSQCIGFRASEKYSAAGTAEPRYRFSPDGLVLYTWGRSMDTVKSLGAIMLGTKEDYYFRDLVRQEWEALARTVSPYHTGELYPTILWRTLIADGQTRGRDSDKVRQNLFQASQYLTMRNRQLEDAKKYPDPGDPPEEMSIVNSRQMEFSALYDAASCGRRVAITDQKSICLVPAETQVGDHLCIFSGVQVPFVLRQEPQSERYRLVGECYVQGWMDGMLFRGSTSPIVEFVIC